MACNICGEKIDLCEYCDNKIEGDFYCYEEIHFCSEDCWKEWLVIMKQGKLKDAIDDKK